MNCSSRFSCATGIEFKTIGILPPPGRTAPGVPRIGAALALLLSRALGIMGLLAICWSPPAVAKSDDQRLIYVIGDSLAGSLWIGVYHAYRGSKKDTVKRYTKISSGIVRYDFYDWQSKAEKLVKRKKMDIAIMMIGGNDRQPIRVAGKRYRERVGTDLWKKTYGDRVEKLIQTFASKGIRFYWVGMPIQRDRRENALGRMINRIFRERCSKPECEYIPIYDMFAGKKGQYVTHLKGDKGRRRLMRHRDGKHFTTSGVKWLGRLVSSVLEKDG